MPREENQRFPDVPNWVVIIVVAIAISMVVSAMSGRPSRRKIAVSAAQFERATPNLSESMILHLLGWPHESHERAGVKRSFWVGRDGWYSVAFRDGVAIETTCHKDEADYLKVRQSMETGLPDRKP